MKFEKAFGPRPKPQAALRVIPRFQSHARLQVCMTTLTIGSAVGGFLLVNVLKSNVERLQANYDGDLVNEDLPCARRTLATCDRKKDDACSAACCPKGYLCIRDPTVGLFCQDRLVTCGDFDYCLDVADTTRTCEKDSCLERTMVQRMTGIVYVIAAAAVIIDIVDLVFCLALSDNVLLKSVGNMISSLVKLLGFSFLIGVGTDGYLKDLTGSGCFNPDGQLTLRQARQVYMGAAAVLFLGSMFSVCLAPISAKYGGRLKDNPKFTNKQLAIGA